MYLIGTVNLNMNNYIFISVNFRWCNEGSWREAQPNKNAEKYRTEDWRTPRGDYYNRSNLNFYMSLM